MVVRITSRERWSIAIRARPDRGTVPRAAGGARSWRAVLTRSNARPRLKCSIYSQSRPGSCDLSTLPHTPVDADDQRVARPRVARPPGGVRCSRATGAGSLVSRTPKPLSLPSRLPSCFAPGGQADHRTTCGAGSGYSFYRPKITFHTAPQYSVGRQDRGKVPVLGFAVNGGVKMYRRGGARVSHGLGGSLSR